VLDEKLNPSVLLQVIKGKRKSSVECIPEACKYPHNHAPSDREKGSGYTTTYTSCCCTKILGMINLFAYCLLVYLLVFCACIIWNDGCLGAILTIIHKKPYSMVLTLLGIVKNAITMMSSCTLGMVYYFQGYSDHGWSQSQKEQPDSCSLVSTTLQR